MSTLSIAVVGAGLMGRQHVQVIAESSSFTLCAIVDPAPAAVALAEAHGVIGLPSLEALLAMQRPDAIVLASPNAAHLQQGLCCVEAGIATLLEKPIATSVVEAKQLVAAVERLGARLLIGHHRAHSPIMAQARAVIAAGKLGRLVAISGRATFYKPDDYFAAGPWRSQPGGGPILINMIHEVGNLRSLCGEIVALQAMTGNAVRGLAVEDTVSVNLRFANGVLGTFLLSDTAASPHSWEQTSGENPAYASYPDQDCYVLSGTDGSLAVPTMRWHGYGHAKERSWWQPFAVEQFACRSGNPLTRQLEHFADVVRGDAEPLVSARDGLRNLAVIEAIAEAARTGCVVELPRQ